MLCGAMWAVASASFMITNGTLGMTIGYPIISIGPMIVSSLWAVLLFREIQGTANFAILAVAIALNLACVLCTALSTSLA